MKRIFSVNDIGVLNLKKITRMTIDTETMGLDVIKRGDRLCLVQIYFPEIDEAHLVHFPTDNMYKKAVNLKKLLKNDKILKIIHYARFDCLVLYKFLGVLMMNVVCTKMMSIMLRTYTDRHGLKDLCREVLKKDINKSEQTSYWGSIELTESQKDYAVQDVLYLNDIYEDLRKRAEKENKSELINSTMKIINPIVLLDYSGTNPVSVIDPFLHRK